MLLNIELLHFMQACKFSLNMKTCPNIPYVIFTDVKVTYLGNIQPTLATYHCQMNSVEDKTSFFCLKAYRAGLRQMKHHNIKIS